MNLRSYETCADVRLTFYGSLGVNGQ